MRSLTCLAALLALTATAKGPQPSPADKAWATTYKAIESRIKAPVFAARDFPITDFGAVAGDPAKLNHTAINSAIEACSKAGGGRVVVPAGTWHTGAITMLSGVNLHVEQGAVLLFTTDTRYYPLVLTRWEGLDCYNYQPLIYAYGQKDIALTGRGTIDGAATDKDWWAMHGTPHHGWTEGVISQKIGRPLLMRWSEAGTPVEQRRMGDGYGMRPQLVNFYSCENVLIEDVTLLRSPFWVLHPLMCKNLTVRGVHMINDGPNGDGCDPESCTDVLIENCFFNTGDDCIAIKSGRNADGRLWNLPSSDIIVRGCRMENGHGGVVVGSEISGGCRNVFVEDCVMDSPELDRVIRIKTNNCRGGVIENIYTRNVTVGQCKEAVLLISLVYEPREQCDRSFPPAVRNVWMQGVTCSKSRYGVFIQGLDSGVNVDNINVTDCSFSGVAEANRIEGLTGSITFNNLVINGQKIQ